MVKVVGAGLAGCEATYQLIKRGIPVKLIEMRPKLMTPAHKTAGFAELVCSNSLRSDALDTAVGILKNEMRTLDSLIMKMGDQFKLPAGSALAVDRNLFSDAITQYLKNHPLVEYIEDEYIEIDDEPTIICTGPLTSDNLYEQINKLFDEGLYFYDAVAPTVYSESINFDKAYFKSRYDKGTSDYINLPFTREEYDLFYNELINAKTVELKEFEDKKHFEGCMPIEELAKRGYMTMAFGPLKPVGLEIDGKRPFAVVQLRQDDLAKQLYNIVGFQTNLTWPEQKRVFSLIPGLENVKFSRLGVMHRNTFINSPLHLNKYYQVTKKPNIFFAGQITGVEGYIESSASGLLAGINMANYLNNKEMYDYKNKSVITSMAYYISHSNPKTFQPMNANFGLVYTDSSIKDKKLKKENYLKQSNDDIIELQKHYG